MLEIEAEVIQNFSIASSVTLPKQSNEEITQMLAISRLTNQTALCRDESPLSFQLKSIPQVSDGQCVLAIELHTNRTEQLQSPVFKALSLLTKCMAFPMVH
jgi:hypothetical protein